MFISFWSPFIDNIATIKAVKNSILSIRKFSKKKDKIHVLNFFGEWSNYRNNFFNNLEIDLVDHYSKKTLEYLPKGSFFKSRFTFIVMFFLSSFPLYKYLRKNKPEYFVIQLLSSLPLLLIFFFNFNTKFILRISGLPDLNIFRKLLWKSVSNKIYLITTQTLDTYDKLLKNKIFDKNKIKVLKDPVFSIRDIVIKKKEKLDTNYNKYFLSIGRLTRQKNQQLLISAFTEFKNKTKSNYKLLIIGDGEKKSELSSLVNSLKMEKFIFFLGYKNNVYKYIFNSECVISSSLWEDPGFVMIESAALKKIIISSNCPNGPKEFIGDDQCGYLFKNNNKDSLVQALNKYHSEQNNEKIIQNKKINALKKTRDYSVFNHYKNIKDLFQNE